MGAALILLGIIKIAGTVAYKAQNDLRWDAMMSYMVLDGLFEMTGGFLLA